MADAQTAVVTGGVSGISRATVERLSPLHALDRLGMQEEVAALVLFLLPNEAPFLTGAVIRVDGGFSARKVT